MSPIKAFLEDDWKMKNGELIHLENYEILKYNGQLISIIRITDGTPIILYTIGTTNN